MSEAENDEARAQEEAATVAEQEAAEAMAGAAREQSRVRPVDDGEPVLIPGRDGGVAIVGAMVKAMGLVNAVGKDAQKKQGEDGDRSGSFSYRAADAVITAVNPALVEAGVLCLPNLLRSHRFDLGSSHVVTLRMEYRFISAEDASVARVVMESSAVGRTAYTIGAGYSYALKYALSQALMIPFDDPRMEMDANESHGAGEIAPRAQRAQREAPAEWWERAGWESLDELAELRADIVARMRVLPPVHLEAMKLRLDALDPTSLFNPENGKRYSGKVWQPKNKKEPKGPGSIATGPTRAAAQLVLDILKSVEADAEREAAGEEPFEVDSPRGEGEPPLAEAAESLRASAAGETPEGEAAIQAGLEREAALGDRTPGQRLADARKATQARSKARRAGARKGGGKDAGKDPEPVSVAPGASEALLEGRRWLTQAMLDAEPGTADQVRETLEDAGHWPIGSIESDEAMTDALTLASLVIQQETGTFGETQ